MRNIDLIRQVISASENNWPHVLGCLNINVPDSPRRHAPCPACGGKDRFRFDDNGRGSFICNQCGAGDGLDLIKRVNNCDTTEAALLAADVLGIDYRTTETPEATSQKREQLETERQRREQERLKRAEKDEQQRRDTFSRQFDDMRRKAVNGKSDYLVAKGVGDFTFPVLPDGSLLLALVDKSGAVTAAQTITSHGEKRLLTGSAKRGAYHAINAPETTQSILIAEGLATALSAHLIRPEALTVAAIDAGNLLYVAQVLRDKFPSAQIIIAADNDHSEGRQNTGRIAAEKAALSVSGWVALPPTDHKADWNDYHQKHGIKCATEAFNKSMYQPQGNGVKQEPQTIEGSDFKVMDTDPLKPRIESREDGIYWVSPRADSQSGEIINNESWLCSPLSVIGTGRDDKDQYLILRWLSFGSETPTTAAIPLADIGEREGWRTLKAGGVNVTTKSSLRAILADWLQRSGSRELWRVAHATGWQCGAYIMPDGEIIGTPENPVLFSGRSSAAAGYTVSGSAKSRPGKSQDRAAVKVLQQFKDDITSGPNDLRLARENRTDLRKRFMASSDTVDKDTLQKASDIIYKAYTADMKKAVAKNLGADEAINMARVDRSWSKFNDMMGRTRVQKAIASGKATPEDVTKLVFSQSPSERSQLYRLLDDNGRQNARAAIVQNAVDKATDPSGNISVEKFINALHRNRKQSATFFKGVHGKELDGVIKYLNDTRHAAKANVQNLNGQQLYGLLVGGGIINAAVLAGMLKTAAFVVPAAGAVGGAAKAYESPVIRNALLRLANTPKGSTAYDRAISTVTQSLTRVAQASQKEAQ